MKRYLKILLASYKFWFMRIFEFRSEVVLWSINSIVWGILSLVSVELIFGQVNSIAGWNRGEVLILTALYFIFDSLLWWFVFPSILVMVGTIADGKLDSYLLKPGSSQFFISFSKFEFDNYPRVIFLIIVLLYLISKFGIVVSVNQILSTIILVAFGVVIFYSLFFMVAVLTFWLQRVFNLEEFLTSVLNVGKAPTQIFNTGLYFVFVFIVPLAFVATFPAQVLLGKSGYEIVVLGGVLAIVFLFISNRFWNFALKRYSSASS